MSNEKKNPNEVKVEAEKVSAEAKEINMDELDEVTGGSLRSAKKKSTVAISDSVRDRV